MNTRLVNRVAREITAAMQRGKRTPAGWAMALEAKGFLTSPEVAAELEALRARVVELEAREAIVSAFVAGRAEYITAIRNCHPDNGHDYDRWQGHAAARRQLAEKLGLPVAWPPEDDASVQRSADKLTRLLGPTQALQPEGEFEATLRHPYRLGHDLPGTDGAR